METVLPAAIFVNAVLLGFLLNGLWRKFQQEMAEEEAEMEE